jgi:hypothetical protein
MTAKIGPPGWNAHEIISRIDGWVVDPDNEDRIPAAVGELIARAMPQPSGDTLGDIRVRMYARQTMYEQSQKVRHHA